MMDNITVGALASFSFLLATIFGLLYLYSLYNLYIGKNTMKHKTILLILNFILLIAYIIILFNLIGYNDIALILLLIIVLAIIILGIIGTIMFNPKYSIDKSDHYMKQTLIVKKVIQSFYIIISMLVIIALTYTLLTKPQEIMYSHKYFIKYHNNANSKLIIDRNNNSSLSLKYKDTVHNKEDIKKIAIYLNDILIYNSAPNISILK